MPEGTVSKSAVCMGCGLSIQDQFVLKCSPDLQWHESCLKCCECSCKLGENATCFVKSGKAYCKSDYARLFMVKCVRCGEIVRKNDLVMRSKSSVYHYNCFSCSVCAKKLQPGDEYQLRDEQIYCKEDALGTAHAGSQLYLASVYNTVAITPDNSVSSSYSPSQNSSSSSVVDSPNNSTSFSSYSYPGFVHGFSYSDHNNSEYQEKEDDRSVSDDEVDQDDEDNDTSVCEENSVGESGVNRSKKKAGVNKLSKPSFQSNYSSSSLLKVNQQGSHKPARIRTVLNEKQLHTLRACYGANPRPDALMKEQLVELTGLNPRVIRVWFQNKRCKDKKKNMLVRPEQSQQQGQHMQMAMHASFATQHIPQAHHNLIYDNCY
ncbi:Insulin enhancer [Brachionus plicatilis]|uniref:Insulin enhancer n=1 Tax=Brachionus plicatilis TaxID=10195 RepID=A0A3M7RVW5_BRAPC|nr:Insulin enhancer [Brachionus plicatilis]